jgi:hypothetical protein
VRFGHSLLIKDGRSGHRRSARRRKPKLNRPAIHWPRLARDVALGFHTLDRRGQCRCRYTQVAGEPSDGDTPLFIEWHDNAESLDARW